MWARLGVLGAMTALAVMVLATGWAGATNPGPSGNGITPTLVEDNPKCTELGYAAGFKVEPVNAGTSITYSVDAFGNEVTVTTTDDLYFDWSSNFGIDAVIAKGGADANVYVYNPESMADTHLHPPVNPANNMPFGISHIEFCFDYNLDVSKTADTTFTRTFGWTIDKSVVPETWDLFTGDSGTSEYTVAVTKDAGTDSNWVVSGTVSIENNTPFAATVTGVTDSISGFGAVTVDCGVTFPHALAAGADLECTYSTALPDGTSRTNTATVTTSGSVGGGSGDADVTFGDPTTLVNDTINVDDTFAGDLGSFSDSGSAAYSRTFTCDEDEGQHDNTATIVETGQSDSASVTVNCYALTVIKDADPSFTRTWDWTIEKTADQTNLLLSEGQLFTVNYQVTVDTTSTDSNHAVSGKIAVNNPAPIDAVLNGVSDIVSPAIVATVDCGVTFPYTLVAGGTLDCTYTADLPDDADRTNTATATLQNHDYDSDEIGTPSGTTDFSGSANVSFSDAPDVELDECIDVSDTNVGDLGTVCAGDAPQTFNYSLSFGANPEADVVLECGDNSHDNTASFVTNDSGATGSDSWTVDAIVACDQGCTLTPGYWKTHSDRGPAPFDDTWNLLEPSAEDTVFFSSGSSYYNVLWTSPAGNAYYILAHAYIAAELNMLNGASVPAAVQDAFDDATALFNTYTPAQIGALKGNKAPRPEFISLAGILDAYNNGISGPGHCSDDGGPDTT
jgi:hypothetical protein